jgi:hypothetical protein
VPARKGTIAYSLSDAVICQNGVSNALAMLTQSFVRVRIEIEVEAGKTYYVRWSVSGNYGKMELVDPANGAKEIEKLHLAKD